MRLRDRMHVAPEAPSEKAAATTETAKATRPASLAAPKQPPVPSAKRALDTARAATSSRMGAHFLSGRVGATLARWVGGAMLLGEVAMGKPPLDAPPEIDPMTSVGEQGVSQTTHGNALRLLVDGPEYKQQLLDSINGAHRSVWLNSFEFQNDAEAGAIADALIAAHNRGLEVRVVIDNRHGSGDFRNAEGALGLHAGRMRDAGVDVRQSRGPALTVNHRKLSVFDGTSAIVTGQNIGGSYMLPRDNGWSYHDAGVFMRGPAVRDVAAAFADSYREASGGTLLALPRRPEPVADDGAQVQVITHSAMRDRNIEREYVQRIDAATERIVLTNGFSMSDSIRDALIRAHDRGVNVTWLWGVASSDTEVMAQPAIGTLIAHGVEVRRYPGPLHMKLASFDDKYVILGSANLDGFSMYRNSEAVLQISDRAFAAQVNARLLAPDLAASPRLAHAESAHNNRDRLLRWVLGPLTNQ